MIDNRPNTRRTAGEDPATRATTRDDVLILFFVRSNLLALLLEKTKVKFLQGTKCTGLEKVRSIAKIKAGECRNLSGYRRPTPFSRPSEFSRRVAINNRVGQITLFARQPPEINPVFRLHWKLIYRYSNHTSTCLLWLVHSSPATATRPAAGEIDTFPFH